MILIEKWDSFCVETKRLGTEKMSQAKSEAEKIIQSGHSHSHKVKFSQGPTSGWRNALIRDTQIRRASV